MLTVPGPTDVKVSILIRSMGPISDVDMVSAGTQGVVIIPSYLSTTPWTAISGSTGEIAGSVSKA